MGAIVVLAQRFRLAAFLQVRFKTGFATIGHTVRVFFCASHFGNK
jgi:hypothetical protein